MPQTEVIFYQERPDDVPVLDWLKALRASDRRGYAKCLARIRRLAELGHELRRPEADYLRDGIYELRARRGRVNYRILYFFHGRSSAVLHHALTKEDVVPDADIDRAVQRKKAFERDPQAHSYKEEED
ncbi:MAG: type II toxin-antitoxin system RelE/ParE family toxin [Planctomycetes bacterium]|nr:type II toxin-antitoxin system RelE/ParE family toxin [Planctomycetota bacterium]